MHQKAAMWACARVWATGGMYSHVRRLGDVCPEPHRSDRLTTKSERRSHDRHLARVNVDELERRAKKCSHKESLFMTH